MEISRTKPSLPRSRQAGMASPLGKWSSAWILRCSWMNTHIGRWGTTLPSNSPGNVPPSHSLGMERGRMSDLPRLLAWPPAPRPSGRHFLPSNQWGTRTLEKRFRILITKFISSGDCQDLHCADQSRYVN